MSIAKDFLNKKNIFAVVGVSRNIKKYGYKVFQDLQRGKYKVYPINPKIKRIAKVKCYASLKDLPIAPDVVITVIPPKITEQIVKQCQLLKISKIWMQPGSESNKAIQFCQDNHIQVISQACIIVQGLINKTAKNEKQGEADYKDKRRKK